MIITGIKASNFKILKAVDIDIPEETGIIKIIGDNGAGKSSFLEAIETALGGVGATPFEPIRHGEEEATITVKLKDDQYGKINVTKVLKKDKKSTLIIKGENNTTFNAPQEMLDSFIGALSFDPLNFFNFKPEKQYEVLKNMLGLSELDDLDNKNQKDFDARTEINRDIKNKKALIAGIKFSNIFKESEKIDVKKLIDNLQKINDKNNKNIIEHQANEHKIIKVRELYVKIKKLRKELEDTVNQHDSIVTEIEKFKQEEIIDVNVIKKEIKEAEQKNKDYELHQVKSQHIIELEQLEKASEVLTEKIEKRKEEKLKLIEKAKMPIENLSLDEGIIRYNNTALSECSTAEKIKVSFAIGVASNYKLKTIFIKEGELLDKKNMKLIRNLAKEKDYNIMIELLNNDNVNERNAMTIIIEDGEIQ